MATLVNVVLDVIISFLTFLIGVSFNTFLYRYARKNTERVSTRACATCIKRLAVISGIGVGLGVPLHLLKHVSTSFNWLCTLHMSIAHSLHVFVSIVLVILHFQRTLAVSPTKTIVYLKISPGLKEVLFYSFFALALIYFIVGTIMFALSGESKNCDVVRHESIGRALHVMHCITLAGISIPCTVLFEALALNTYLTLKHHVDKMSSSNTTGNRKINVKKILWSLQVTAIYYILWYPLTFLKLFQDIISNRTYYMLLSYFQSFTYMGFAIIPFVYASLDKRFLTYIAEKQPFITVRVAADTESGFTNRGRKSTNPQTRATTAMTK